MRPLSLRWRLLLAGGGLLATSLLALSCCFLYANNTAPNQDTRDRLQPLADLPPAVWPALDGRADRARRCSDLTL